MTEAEHSTGERQQLTVAGPSDSNEAVKAQFAKNAQARFGASHWGHPLYVCQPTPKGSAGGELTFCTISLTRHIIMMLTLDEKQCR